MGHDGQIGPLGVVLFVDDDHGNAYVEALRIAGYRVEVAPTALQALERASSMRPDALIVPLLMPGMSGSDLAHRIGAENSPARTLAVVVLTRVNGDQPPDGAAAAGAAFCKLPCAPSDLVTMVEKQLSTRRLLG